MQNGMNSFKHSCVNFRNKREIKASLVFVSHGELRLPYMEKTLLGKSPPFSLLSQRYPATDEQYLDPQKTPPTVILYLQYTGNGFRRL